MSRDSWHPYSNDYVRDESAAAIAVSSAPLDVSGLDAWLNHIGVPGQPEQLNKEMQTVMSQLNGIRGVRPVPQVILTEFSGCTGSGASSERHVPWVQFVPVVIAVPVWIVGLFWIARKLPRNALLSQRNP